MTRRRLSLLLLCGLLLILAAIQALDITARWRDAEAATVVLRLGGSLGPLSKAAQNLAFERGRTNVILRGAAPIAPDNRLFLDQRRAEGSHQLAQAIAGLAPHLANVARRLQERLDALDALRGRVDAALKLPRDQRPADLPPAWFDAASGTMAEIQAAMAAANTTIGTHYGIVARLGEIALLSLQFRDASGIESSTLASAISAGSRPDAEALQSIAWLRGRGDALWSSLTRDLETLNQPELNAARLVLEQTFFTTLRPLQDDAVAAWLRGGMPTLATRNYTQASVAGLDAIVNLTTTAVHAAVGRAVGLRAAAIGRLWLSVVVLAALAVGVVTLGWLWRRECPVRIDDEAPDQAAAGVGAAGGTEAADILAVLDDAGIGLARLDDDGRLAGANGALGMLFSQVPALLNGRRLTDLLPGLIVPPGGDDWHGEAVTVSGHPVALLLSRPPDGTAPLVVMHDNAAAARQRHHLEDRVRAVSGMLDLAAAGLLAVDRDGFVTYANPAALERFGIRLETLLGKELHTMLHHSRKDGSPYPGDQCPVWQTLRDGQVRRAENDVHWRPDGGAVPLDYTVRAMWGETGDSIAGAVITIALPAIQSHDTEVPAS